MCVCLYISEGVCECVYSEMVVCVHELQCGLPLTAEYSSCRILARMCSCANSVLMASTCVRLRSLSQSILLRAGAHPTTHTHTSSDSETHMQGYTHTHTQQV